MSNVVSLIEWKTSKCETSREELLAHPLRSEHTPESQSGVPLFLIREQDGSTHLRTSYRGYSYLDHLQGELPLTVNGSYNAHGQKIYSPITLETTEEEALQLTERLQQYFVAHAWESTVKTAWGGSFHRELSRLALAPASSPIVSYLWGVQYFNHGDLWLLGTPEDLDRAHEILSAHGMVEVLTPPWGLQGLRVSWRTSAQAVSWLRSQAWWVRVDDFACGCCS